MYLLRCTRESLSAALRACMSLGCGNMTHRVESGNASGVFTLSAVTFDPIDFAAPAALTVQFVAAVSISRGDVVALVLPGGSPTSLLRRG